MWTVRFDAEHNAVVRISTRLRRMGSTNPWRQQDVTKVIETTDGEPGLTQAIAVFADGMRAPIENLTCQQWTLYQGKAGQSLATQKGEASINTRVHFLGEHGGNKVRVRNKPDKKPMILTCIEESECSVSSLYVTVSERRLRASESHW